MHVLTTHRRAPLAAGVVGALASLAVAIGVAGGPVAAVVIAALVPAAAAAVVDARTGRLPNALVFATLVPPVAVLSGELLTGHGGSAFVSLAAGAVVFAGPILVVHLVSPAAMGFGDVKLAAALGATLGLVDPRAGLVALCLATAGTAAVGLVARRSSMPLGPGLVVGAAGALILAARFGGSPLPWR